MHSLGGLQLATLVELTPRCNPLTRPPCPQLMVLLTAGLRPANPREIKLQCLEGWLGLVRALAAEAPVQLGGIVNQVRVGGRPLASALVA